jgi:hypothetical protein
VISEAEAKAIIRIGAMCSRFSERISKLPKHLQNTFLADLETTIDNRLKVLEKVK